MVDIRHFREVFGIQPTFFLGGEFPMNKVFVKHMMQVSSIESSTLAYGSAASEVKKGQTESFVPCLWKCPVAMWVSAHGSSSGILARLFLLQAL